MLHLTSLTFIILLSTGFVAGLVDSTAGGGGLITLPVLLGLGVPPATALGTNRLQGFIGEFVAIRRFLKSGELKLSELKLTLFYAVLGSIAGSLLVQLIQAEVLHKVIPILLSIMIFYSAISGRLFTKPVQIFNSKYFALLFGLTIGFYNGFFGPGTGALWFAAFLMFYGLSVKHAAMNAKPPNMVGNIASFLCFISQLHVAILAGLVLGLGQIFGANVGAHLVLNKGAKVIRPIFLVMVTVMTIELLFRAF